MVKIKEDWKYQDTTAEEKYEQQSIAASQGQKVTRTPSASVKRGPILVPEF